MLSSESTAHILASTPFFWAEQTCNSPAGTLDAVASVKRLVTASLIFLGEKRKQYDCLCNSCERTTVEQCSSSESARADGVQ